MGATLVLKAHVKGYTKTVNGKQVLVREHDDKRTKKSASEGKEGKRRAKVTVLRRSRKHASEGDYFKKLSPKEQHRLLKETVKIDEAKGLKFQDVAQPNVAKDGDALLIAGKTTGYNVTTYDAASNELVNEWKGSGNKATGGVNWSYSMYTAHPEHIRDLVARFRLEHIDVPVGFHIKASAVYVPEDEESESGYAWPQEPEGERETHSGYAIDRTVEVTAVFKCLNDRQAAQLQTLSEVVALKKDDIQTGKTDKKGNPIKRTETNEELRKRGAIPESWVVPDTRSSSPKVSGMYSDVMNIKNFGKQSLVVLHTSKEFDGFEHYKIGTGRVFHDFIKYVSGLVKSLDLLFEVEKRWKSVFGRG
ncbi:MAG: hypothetical protein M1378_00270 [Bacteroidetes bacterium]|nr:hypothetical protein [Bacteroidota bacterium]